MTLAVAEDSEAMATALQVYWKDPGELALVVRTLLLVALLRSTVVKVVPEPVVIVVVVVVVLPEVLTLHMNCFVAAMLLGREAVHTMLKLL